MPDAKPLPSAVQAILDRRSIRRFQPAPLSAAQLDTLVEVALASPTARDRQPWHFSFVTDPKAIAAVSDAGIETLRREGDQAALDRLAQRGGGLFYEAPLVVFLSYPDDAYKGLDCGIAAENLAVAATAMGLGSCIIAMGRYAFQGERGGEMARLVGIPDGFGFVVAVAVGVPATTKEPHERHPEKVTFVRESR